MSSNHNKLGNDGRRNIFGRFLYSMVGILLEMAWSNFGVIGGFFAHEMIKSKRCLRVKPGFKESQK